MEVIALVILFFAAVGLQGAIFRILFFYKLDYSCFFSVGEAYEGDDIFFVEVVHNKKLLPLPWLKADIHSSRWLDFAGTNSVVAQDNRRVTSSFFLRSYQRTTRRWKLKCLKRGVFTTENVTLIGGDLLGNDTLSIPVQVGASLVVYPGTVDLEEMLIPVNYLQGDTIVKRWIVDDPFIISGAREYTPGDPMNRIHWSATARAGSLMVKKNDFTARMNLTILLNIQSIEFEYNDVVYRDRIELGIKIAATMLDKALGMCIPVRFGTNGDTVDDRGSMIFTAEASGKEHACDIMKILSKLELKNVRDFEDFLAEYCCSMSNTDVVIITSYISEGICSHARNLKRQGNLVKLIILNSLIEAEGMPEDIDIFVIRKELDNERTNNEE